MMDTTTTLAACELLHRAARMLDDQAAELRRAHTLAPAYNVWRGQPDAQTAHDEFVDTAARLYLLAKNLKTAMQRVGISRAAEDAWQRRDCERGMIVCHAVSATLLPAVEEVAQHLERTHPKSSGEQRVEMIFSAGVHALMRDAKVSGAGTASAGLPGCAAREET